MLFQKVAAETSSSRRILVVARLPRLISFIKSKVREANGCSLPTCDYFTYDELLTSLVRCSRPTEPSDARSFAAFNAVHFGETTGTGATPSYSLSFQSSSIEGYLEDGERAAMKKNRIEQLTLWTAIRTIKSHATVAKTKQPLSEGEYLALPPTFGLDEGQRSVAYRLYERYNEWIHSDERPLWDEADRVLYCLKHGDSVFSDEEFHSWATRAFQWGEEGYADKEDMPSGPFYHSVHVDEAQDMSDLDLALFIRMSSGIRSMFLAADPAQSVELGLRMRDGGINNVFHSFLPEYRKNVQVKTFLQDLYQKKNHRTHQQNLDLSRAIRSILARSFKQPFNEENAISKGPLPEALILNNLSDLTSKFKGARVVFICPDEILPNVRETFRKLGLCNDVFGVRDAKGLGMYTFARRSRASY